MMPVRNLLCSGCKAHWFVGYSGEAKELYCADCAKRKAMGHFGLPEKDDPAILPTFMFENVLDEMDRLMGREVKPRPRAWAKPTPAPPPTTEWIRPSKAEFKAMFYLGVFGLVGVGFIFGFLARGAS